MPKAKILKHFYISPELAARLAEAAKKHDMSQAQIVRNALDTYLTTIEGREPLKDRET